MKNRVTTTVLIIGMFAGLVSVADDALDDATSGKNVKFEITKVKVEPKSITPSNNESAILSFEFNKDANAQVVIYDELSQKVRRFDLPNAKAGVQSVEWNGLDSQNNPALGNLFLYVIEASDMNGNHIIYNPVRSTAGLAVEAQDYTFDHETGKIEYVLPKACMVRLRAGLKDSAVLRTILDWSPQEAGRHFLKWDGKDETGLFNIGKHPELNLNLTCYTLPGNTIITEKNGTVELLEEKNKNKSSETDDLWVRKGKYLHYSHDPRNCHEPKFTLSFPENKKTNDKDIPVLSGRVSVRIDINEDDAAYMVNRRFEIMFYIDGVFLFEMEEGTSPFTSHWNTQGFSKGPHIMTVNLMSYDDHIGVVNRQVIVGE